MSNRTTTPNSPLMPGSRPTRTSAAAVILCLLVPACARVAAQEYEILGSLTTEATAGYFSDTYALLQDRSGSDRVEPDASLMLDATHRFFLDRSELVVDHSLRVVRPDVPDVVTPGEVSVAHHVNQSYLLLMPAPWLNVSLGRQRLNWGAGFTFSSTDALHPRPADYDGDTGFDGAAVTLLGGPDFSVELALAMQDALTTGDVRDLRTAAFASAYVRTVELGASFVYQEDNIYRPGVLGSIPVGPVLLVGEAAIEVFGEPEVAEPRPIMNAAAEYTYATDRWNAILVGEYIFNGLADDALFRPVTPRLTDNAGGFAFESVQYAFFDVSLVFGSDWSTSHSGLVNLEDGSALIGHEVAFLVFDGVDLGLGFAWTGGAGDTEFGGEAYPYHLYGRAWVEVHF